MTDTYTLRTTRFEPSPSRLRRAHCWLRGHDSYLLGQPVSSRKCRRCGCQWLYELSPQGRLILDRDCHDPNTQLAALLCELEEASKPMVQASISADDHDRFVHAVFALEDWRDEQAATSPIN